MGDWPSCNDEAETSSSEDECGDETTEMMEAGEEDEEADIRGGSPECMATSLFDALAAAQEASEKYSALENGPPREDHRLPDDFLLVSYQECLVGGWRDNQDADEDVKEEGRYRRGYLCEAIWPGDGQWYPARIAKVKEWKKKFVVRYRGFPKDEDEEVGEEELRPRQRKRKKTRKHRGSKKQKVDEPTKEKQEEQIDFLEEAKMLKERIEINAEAVKKQFSK